jgi:hypothetical protein
VVFADFREKFHLSSQGLKVSIRIFRIRPNVDIRDQTCHKMKTTAQHYHAVCKCTHLQSVGVWRNVWAGNGPISDCLRRSLPVVRCAISLKLLCFCKLLDQQFAKFRLDPEFWIVTSDKKGLGQSPYIVTLKASRRFPNCAARYISKYCIFFQFMYIILSNGSWVVRT